MADTDYTAGFRAGQLAEQERILKLIFTAQFSVYVDENTTDRDLEAMNYAKRKLRYAISDLIKEGNK